MATVKISSDFFTNEIRNYSNWALAFWRELFQNSVDANANNISVNIEEVGRSCIVSFQDNGCGMSREVLEDVFFNLGTTTKNTHESIGGFGRARIILCFAQQDYIIYTQNNIASGSGANYEIQENDGNVQGCKFIITVNPEKFGSNNQEFIRCLELYLELSQIEPFVFINGAKFNSKLYKRGKTKELSFGTAYANKNGTHKNKIIFRVNGVPMFHRYTRSDAQIIVEIKPELSREVLLSNRDSISWRYIDEVEKFASECAIDTLSAFREKLSEDKQVIGSARKFIPKNKNINFDNTLAVDILNHSYSNLIESVNTSYKNSGPGICIVTNTQNSKVKKASKSFSLETLYDNKSKKSKLFNLWTVACEHALESYCKFTNTENVNWMPGFIFDESCEACNQSLNDSFALLLNPLHCMGDNVGNIRYNINNFQSQMHMLALAAHEVCHCKYDYHDEKFASLFTDVISDMMSNIKEITRDFKLANCKI